MLCFIQLKCLTEALISTHNLVFYGEIRKKYPRIIIKYSLTLVLLNQDFPVFVNSVDPDQLASEEATDLDLHCLSLSM